jgi:hypothetical protein
MERHDFEYEFKPFTDEMIPQLKTVTEFRFMPSRKKYSREEKEGRREKYVL